MSRTVCDEVLNEVMEIEFLVRECGRTSGKLMKRVTVRMSLSDFIRSLTGRGFMFGDYKEWSSIEPRGTGIPVGPVHPGNG